MCCSLRLGRRRHWWRTAGNGPAATIVRGQRRPRDRNRNVVGGLLRGGPTRCVRHWFRLGVSHFPGRNWRDPDGQRWIGDARCEPAQLLQTHGAGRNRRIQRGEILADSGYTFRYAIFKDQRDADGVGVDHITGP
jgi:hypothetical protein